MPVTWNPQIVNETYTSLSTTTSEDVVTIQCSPLTPGAVYPGGPTPVIQLRSDQAWLYSSVSGSKFYPVAAGEVFNYRVLDPFAPNKLFVKSATTSGNLYGLRVQ